MRLLVLASTAILALALAGAAQAGEGCPHSKGAAVSASAQGEGAPDSTGHHAACAHTCDHAAAGAKSCPCSHARTGDETTASRGSDAPAPGAVAAND